MGTSFNTLPLADPTFLAMLGLTGAAGFAPTSSSGSGSSSTSGTTSSNIQSLLNTLSQLTGRTQQTTTTTPTQTPEGAALMKQLASKYSGLTNVNLAPYQAQQSEAINRSSDLQSNAVRNIMAARGLATSPVAGTAEAGVQSQRFGALTNLSQQIPLLQNQLTLQNLAGASNLYGELPRGSTAVGTGTTEQTGSTAQTGSTTSQGTQTQNQNYQNQQQTGGGLGSMFGGIAGILASLFP